MGKVKITFLHTLALIFAMCIVSCETLDDLANSINTRTAKFSNNLEQKQIEKDWDAENWDLSEIDTSRSVRYLTEIEKNVILELNKVRTNPKKYAELYLVPTLGYYQGKDLHRPGKITIRTVEGRSAVDECIKVLSTTKPLNPLLPSEALTLAALDHTKDTGPVGIVGHTGNDGSSLRERINRYDKSLRTIAETIDYGSSRARDIVTSLIVDDGVRSRGHRKIILMSKLDIVGLSIGDHSGYGKVCVIDYAESP
jgi:hypothetical protein